MATNTKYEQENKLLRFWSSIILIRKYKKDSEHLPCKIYTKRKLNVQPVHSSNNFSSISKSEKQHCCKPARDSLK